MMKKIHSGKTGLSLLLVGVSGIPLTRPSEEDAIGVIHHELEHNVNCVDTAILIVNCLSIKW